MLGQHYSIKDASSVTSHQPSGKGSLTQFSLTLVKYLFIPITLQDHIAIAADNLLHTLNTFTVIPPPEISPQGPKLKGF